MKASALVPLLCVAAAGLLCGPRPARGSDRIGPVEVITLSQSVESWGFGYIEHRFRLRNLGDRAHTVTIDLPARTYGGHGATIDRIRRTAVIHPGDAVMLSLPQPAHAMPGRPEATVTVHGVDSGLVIVPSMESAFQRYHGSRTPVFVSRGVNSDDLAKALEPEKTTRSGRPGASEIRLTRAESEIAAWTSNWIGYSCFAGVVLSAEEWRSAPASVREALFRYVACGGIVICAGAIDIPDRWILGRSTLQGGGTAWHIGMGRLVSITRPEPEGWDSRDISWLTRMFRLVPQGWNSDIAIPAMHSRFPVVEHLSAPVGGILVLLLVFAFLAGPLLLWVLARTHRRIWLLWIMPAAAVAACLVIALHSLIAEGITPSRRASTLVLLDQVRQEGVAIGLAGFYTPLAPGGGLRFSPEATLTAIEPRFGPHQRPRRLDLTRDQHLASGWLQARVPAYFQVRKPFSARERIDIQPTEDGGWSVVNGLGADILRLDLHAPDGRRYRSGPLPAGGRIELYDPVPGTTRTGSIADTFSGFLGRVPPDWGAAIETLAPENLNLLRGSYAAELERCPFVEPGLAGRAHRREYGLVIGRFTDVGP